MRYAGSMAPASSRDSPSESTYEQSERAVVTKSLAELDGQFTLVALDQIPGRS
jgi:hypothetical protein